MRNNDKMKIYGNLPWVQHPYDALREDMESNERKEKSEYEYKVMKEIEYEESWELRERCLASFNSCIFTIPADGMESLFYGAIWTTQQDDFFIECMRELRSGMMQFMNTKEL